MEIVPVHNNTITTWQIILSHGIKFFDYTMINSLIVSKSHDVILQQTANVRKQYFLRKKPYLQRIHKDLEWNRYGSACAKVSVGCGSSFSIKTNTGIISHHQEKVLLFEGRRLLDRTLGLCESFEKFYDYLPLDRSRLFFSFGDSMHCYGYGEMKSISDEKSGDVVEYCVAPEIKAIYKCVTQIEGIEVPLMIFLEFPSLLKAFLDSSSIFVSTSSVDVKKDKKLINGVKICALDGVAIPDNYRLHKNYFLTPLYSSFKKIPKCIRKVIAQHYDVQQNKLKKISLLSRFGI
jgi:hypothetical protein